MQMKEHLYGKNDPLGVFLSFWRNTIVAKEVKGELVDLACGDNRLVRKYGKGRGVDIVEFEGADLVAPDFTNLPLPDESADTVTIVASLNYFPDPTGVLREAKRILRKNGRLLVTMSNLKVMKVWHKFRDRKVKVPGISEDSLLDLLENSGYILKKKKPFMLFVNVLYVAEPIK